MAKLFSRTGATAHQDPEGHQFTPGDDGAFSFPDDLSDLLLRQYVRKKRMWEDEEMRAGRMHQESEERHRDPAVLYAAVAELVQLSKGAQAAAAAASPDLLAMVAELRKELDELREQNAAPAGGGGTGAKPAAAAKTPAAKTPAPKTPAAK